MQRGLCLWITRRNRTLPSRETSNPLMARSPANIQRARGPNHAHNHRGPVRNRHLTRLVQAHSQGRTRPVRARSRDHIHLAHSPCRHRHRRTTTIGTTHGEPQQ
jgi:hypothetical protein